MNDRKRFRTIGAVEPVPVRPVVHVTFTTDQLSTLATHFGIALEPVDTLLERVQAVHRFVNLDERSMVVMKSVMAEMDKQQYKQREQDTMNQAKAREEAYRQQMKTFKNYQPARY